MARNGVAPSCTVAVVYFSPTADRSSPPFPFREKRREKSSGGGSRELKAALPTRAQREDEAERSWLLLDRDPSGPDNLI